MFWGIIFFFLWKNRLLKVVEMPEAGKSSYNIFFYKYLYCSTTFLRTIWFVSATLFSWRYSNFDIYNDTGKLMKSFKHLLGNRQDMPSDTFAHHWKMFQTFLSDLMWVIFSLFLNSLNPIIILGSIFSLPLISLEWLKPPHLCAFKSR